MVPVSTLSALIPILVSVIPAGGWRREAWRPEALSGPESAIHRLLLTGLLVVQWIAAVSTLLVLMNTLVIVIHVGGLRSGALHPAAIFGRRPATRHLLLTRLLVLQWMAAVST